MSLTIKPTKNEDVYHIGNSPNVFSCDLASNARTHVDFLKSIHEYYITFNDHDLNKGSHESLRRYQELWLPLVAAAAAAVTTTSTPTNVNGNETTTSIEALYPPPDVAWLWHCHRLAPKHYTNYCHRNFGGRIIEAHPPFEMAHPTLVASTTTTAMDPLQMPQEQESSIHQCCYFQRTLDLWSEMYPDEPFFLDKDSVLLSETNTESSSAPSLLLQGFDLLGSIHRQADFLWQVSGERFGDDDFLNDGVMNYYRFLQLKPHAAKQGMILVPTYQIDLMWHTHMLSSIEMYNADCIRIMKATLHHDDSLTDRSEGGILDVSFTGTKSLWMKHYGTEYVVTGGMYRGEPPTDYYTSQWRSYDDSLPATITNIALIGRVGASSIGQTHAIPTQWAPLDGTASDGSPAFIETSSQWIYANRFLQYKADYVLGRHGNKTGYYHIETRAANEILKTRVHRQISKTESQLAMAKCCCGSEPSIQALEQKRTELLNCHALLSERLAAPIPCGSTKVKTIGSANVNRDDGVWIYPPVLYSSAGGACGGAVGYAGCGGSACGGGGGGGGGGCGGGGCGGGGCGG